MKKREYLFVLSIVLNFQLLFAEEHVDRKVIYKWKQQGLIHYSHIKPVNIQSFERLDAEGQKIEAVSADSGETVEMVVRPPKKSMSNQGASVITSQTSQKNKLSEQKQKNCEIAHKNHLFLQKGVVYEKDASGDMVRLTDEQLATKMRNTQKDIDYFCSP